MKYCHNCGTQLSDSAKFCPQCGTSIPSTEEPHEPATAESAQNRPVAVPIQSQTTSVTNQTEAHRQVNSKKRWGIAAQFDVIAAGKKPKSSYFTYLYGFFQLLYHKSYQLFCRTYLPCCIAMLIDFALLGYALTAVPASSTLSAIAFLLLLLVAIWFVVVSIWISRYYPQELYKQVQGDADKIPANIFSPILGGFVLVVLAVAAALIGYLLAPTGPSDSSSEASAYSTTEIVPEATPVPATTAPTEAPSMTSEPIADSTTDTSLEEYYCLVPVAEPWKGAWCSPDGSELFIFEADPYGVDTYMANDDGSTTIYRADERDGSVYEIYTFSADETELTKMDPDGNVLGTYYRPTYDMAPNPLPASCWGDYMLVQDNTVTEYNPFGSLNQLGSSDNFIIDAFRFGSYPYEQLTDNGNGTWSAYFPIPPEGGFYTFGFVAEGEDMYMEIYDDAGNVRGRYQRLAQ